MYVDGNWAFNKHKENYGRSVGVWLQGLHQGVYRRGFSAKTWIDNTVNIGAKFAVGMAVHRWFRPI